MDRVIDMKNVISGEIDTTVKEDILNLLEVSLKELESINKISEV